VSFPDPHFTLPEPHLSLPIRPANPEISALFQAFLRLPPPAVASLLHPRGLPAPERRFTARVRRPSPRVRRFINLAHIVPPRTTHLEKNIPRVLTLRRLVATPYACARCRTLRADIHQPRARKPTEAPSIKRNEPHGEQHRSAVPRRRRY